MLLLFLACNPISPEQLEEKDAAQYGEGARALQLIYSANMDGEIEPCG